jgi:hypothetical protein
MKENTHVIKYEAGRFNSDAANDEIYCADTTSLKYQLKKNNDKTIYIASAIQLVTTVELAFKYQAIVYINPKLKYDFSNQYNKSKGNLINSLKLLTLAQEPVMLTVGIAIVAKYLKHQVPFKMPLKSALNLVKQSINPLLDAEAALLQFTACYEQYRKQTKKFIAPADNEKIKKIKLSYQHDLLDFLKSTDGIFFLTSGMGSGKSVCIKALYENLCSSTNIRPTILTPDIALSKQILNEYDKRHYLNNKKNKSVAELTGLVCCVNSATTNDKFFEYAQASEVLLVEEIEECLLALSQDLIKSGSLPDRAKAMSRFFSLFHKNKIICADALFSDLTARQIIEETGKTIYLIETTDKIKLPKKTIKLMSRDAHIECVINQVDGKNTEIGFSDGAQKESNYFFKLHDVIKSKTNKLTKIINATFIKSKNGGEFLKNVAEFLVQYNYIQISPVLTSGLHFLIDTITRVNLFASQTILPTQLLQSSGRFRFAELLQISFSDIYKKYPKDDKSIVMDVVVKNSKGVNFYQEYEYLIDCPHAKRVVERIKNNNLMRINYENNTLILFELLGGEIQREEQVNTTEIYISKTSPQELLALKTLTQVEYQNFQYQWEELDKVEREQCLKYETLKFYNVLNKEKYHLQVLDFDTRTKSRQWLRNLKLCREPQKCETLTSEDRVKQKVFLKAFELLNIDIMTLEGKYDLDDMLALEEYLLEGEIELHGQFFKLQDINFEVFGFITAKSKYKVTVATGILEKHFGLTHERLKRDKKKKSGQYLYQTVPAIADNINELYNLAYADK